MGTAKYTPEDILQILKDSYNFQSVFDPEVDAGTKLTFDTSVEDWISICDLVGPKKLAAYYQRLFDISGSSIVLENILVSEKSNLRDFCNYLAEQADRKLVMPIVVMGAPCLTAAIFKTLMRNLADNGVDVKDVRPDSSLAPLFTKKDAGKWLEQVSKLAPGTIGAFRYKENRIQQTGAYLIGASAIMLIIVSLLWQFHWTLLLSIALGIIVLLIGDYLRPAYVNIDKYNTVRDLINGMHIKMG